MELPPESQQLLEVATGNLQPGMYIAGLDRPWLETPFAVQGFFVRDNEDISFVAKHCAYVYIDPKRLPDDDFKAPKSAPHAPVKRNSVSLKSEFKEATVELETASQAMNKVFQKLGAGGNLDVRAMQRIVNPLINSVMRNSEAMAVDLANYDSATDDSSELWVSRELEPCACGIQPDAYFL